MEDQMMRRRGVEAVIADPLPALVEGAAQAIDQARPIGGAIDGKTGPHVGRPVEHGRLLDTGHSCLKLALDGR